MSPIGSEEITFGRFRLHPRRRELLRDEVPVRLHRRALDILCALAAAKGAIVGRDELLALLWPGRIVEEGNLHVHVSALRKALGEDGEGHSYIVTVPGRGYRLAGFTGAVPADSAAAPSPRPLPPPASEAEIAEAEQDMLACSGGRRPRSAPLEGVDTAGCPDYGCCGADRA